MKRLKRCPTSTRRSARSARRAPDLPQQGRHDRLHPGRPRRRPGRNRPKRRRRRSSTPPARPRRPACRRPSAATSASSSRSRRPRSARRSASPPRSIILLFAFGTATAMMLPIVSAVLGLACALSIIRLLEHVVEVPGVASTLATMIGLGVGIDYALFIVTRHKLQLRDGMEMHESIARATATAGGAVVFAGFTVVIALCSLAFAGIPLVSTLGFTAAIAVVVAVCAAATLLPAMLGALGPRINSLRVQLGKTHPDDKEPHGWRRWAERRRRPALALGDRRPRRPAGPRALPIFQLELGQNDIGALPKDTTSRQAYDGARQGLRPRLQRPAADRLRIQDAGRSASQALPGLREADRRHRTTSPRSARPTFDKTGTVAVFTVISNSAPWADATVELVEDLRDTVIPKATGGDGRDRLRRRPDRRLHRPRHPDRRQAAADDRDRRRAQLLRPAARLPLAAGADQGGGDEPALGRRRLRRRHRGLPARLGRPR